MARRIVKSRMVLRPVAVLGPVIRHQKLCIAITVLLGVHFSLMALGLPSLPCPIRHGLGIPGPGCGMSRAIKALITGHWQRSLSLHAFAPIAIFGMTMIMGATILPRASRHAFAMQLERVEQKTGVSLIFLSAFLMYWLGRLLFFRSNLDQLL